MPVLFDSPKAKTGGVVFDDAPKRGVVFDEPAKESDADFVLRTHPELVTAPPEQSYFSKRTSRAFETAPGGAEVDAKSLGTKNPLTILANTNIGRNAIRGATSDGGIYSALGGIAEGVANLPAGAGAFGMMPGGLPQIVKDAAKWYGEGVDLTRDSIRRAFPVDREFAESTPGGVAQGLGQAGAMLPLAVLGPAAAPAMLLSSAGGTFDEGFQEAKAAGATDKEAFSVGMKYLPSAGADFLADRLLAGKVLRPLGGAFSPVRALKDIAGAAASGAGSEALQTRWLNEIASRSYDPGRDPNEGVGQAALVGGLVPGGLTTTRAALDVVAGRAADKTQEQASKLFREEAKATEDKSVADALTDAADTLDREIAAREVAEKAAADQQKAIEAAQKEAERIAKEQQKAQAEAQKAAEQAMQPPEIPKSAQILAESATPPSIANVATEVGTQTSPFALQGKLNEMTALPAQPGEQPNLAIAPDAVPAPPAVPQGDILAPAAPVPAAAEATPAPVVPDLGDQPVKFESRHVKAGEITEIEMTAKDAKEFVDSRIEVMNRILECMGA